MTTLICFGLGYSAEHFIGMFGDGFDRIIGTVRGAERAAVLSAHLAGRLKALVFDGALATPEVKSAIGEADQALVSVPPNEKGDPVLAAFGDSLRHARRLRSVVYLSTVGVLRQPQRRVGRRDDTAAAGCGPEPAKVGRRESLATTRRA